MPELRSSNPRKRRRTEHSRASRPQSKRQKSSHPTAESRPSAAFWDNLSKIWLTRRALQELDRRNSDAALGRPRSSRRLHRPITRGALAEWNDREENWQPKEPTTDIVSHSAGYWAEIRALARHGGPDLRELRGYQAPINPLQYITNSTRSIPRSRTGGPGSTSTKPTTTTTTTRKSRPYDRNFQQNLIDHYVFPDRYEYPDGRQPPQPENWDEINQRLGQSRPSLSPSKFSDGDFRDFSRADAHAAKEKQVTDSVIPIIEGKVRDAKCIAGGIPFTNLDHLTDGNIVPGNPDRYYGARPEQLDRRIREELGDQIVPSTQHDLPVAPNFFLAAKGPDGSLAVAGRQASYDGALGARGIHSLQSYGQGEPVYNNNACTITSIYHGGQLKMYTSHPLPPASPGGCPEYSMTLINSWSMTGNVRTFQEGAAAYRNGRDWAKEQRDEAITRANERARSSQAQVVTIDASGSPASSVASEASVEEPLLSQDSLTSLDSNTTVRAFEPRLSEDKALGSEASAKHSRKHSDEVHRHRKRHNPGEPTDGASEFPAAPTKPAIPNAERTGEH